MADPLNIAGACLSALGFTAKAVIAVKAYISLYRNTRSDLAAVIREIADYEMIIEVLQGDREVISGRSPGPRNITQRISQIIKGSEPTFKELEAVLEKHKQPGTIQSAWWVISGKEQILRFQSIIATHRATLSLALGVSHRFG